MNLISDIESELALAVLIEKKHTEKINSKDVLPLLKRLNEALESASLKKETPPTAPIAVQKANSSSH